MNCPLCGFENLPGADECESCHESLTFLDEPTADSPVERILMEDPTRKLRPVRPVCVAPHLPLSEVLNLMIDKRIGCVLVADGSELLGVFTERDLVMKIAGREQELAADPVQNWMTSNPETVDTDDSIALAVHKMDVGGYRHLPVMEAGRVKGLISVRDIVRSLAMHLAEATN